MTVGKTMTGACCSRVEGEKKRRGEVVQSIRCGICDKADDDDQSKIRWIKGR